MSRNYLVTPRAAIYTSAVLVAALGLFAMPAHAAEPPTSAAGGISINIDPAEEVVNLTSQNSYKATTHITVTSRESNGFKLTMAASGIWWIK